MTEIDKYEIAELEAIAARDEYLKKNPELQAYQKEITEMLDKIPNQQDKIVTLIMIMTSNIAKMQDAWSEVQAKSDAIIDAAKPLLSDEEQ